MVAIVMHSEAIVRVGDKIRLDASRTTYIPDSPSVTIASVTIQPETSAAAYNVTGSPVSSKNWVLDWFYQTPGMKTVTVTVTLSDATVVSKTFSVTAKSISDDKLLVDDPDLTAIDFDIMRYIPDGYSSWRHVHRKVTNETLEFIRSMRIKRTTGEALQIDDIINSSLARRMATASSLALIYQQLSNKPDDKFYAKFIDAKKELEQLRASPSWSLDIDADGNIDDDEEVDMKTGRLLRG